MDCDSFVLSIEADKLIRDLTKLREEKDLLVFLLKLINFIPDMVIRIQVQLVNSKLQHLIQYI